MPYIKDSFSILAECAAIDLPDTKRVVRESEVRVGYESIAEASSDYRFTAEMVPVVELNGKYYTEAQCLAPFMRDAGIKSMMEALDAVAESNQLEPKAIGLLIESSCKVNEMIERACQKESGKAKDAVIEKIDKAAGLANTLKENGYPVMRKMNEMTEEEKAKRRAEKEKMDKIKEKEHQLRNADKEANDKVKSGDDAGAREKDAEAKQHKKELDNIKSSKNEHSLFDFDFN